MPFFFYIVLAIMVMPFSDALGGKKIAENSDSSLTFFKTGVRLRTGFILPHRASVKYLNQDFCRGFDLEIAKKTSGKVDWHNIYNLPEIGLGLHYFNTGNVKQLGNIFSFYGFIDKKVFKKNYLSYRMAWGISYITKAFDVQNNYFNIIIGSHINNFAEIGIESQFSIGNKLLIKPHLSITHYSNGSFKKPNLGINIVNTGISFLMNTNYTYAAKNIKPPDYSLYVFSINSGLGFRQNYPPESTVFMAKSLWANSSLRVSNKRLLGLGVDVFHDPSLNARNIELENSTTDISNFRSGFHISHTVEYGRIDFMIQIGVYTYDKAKDNGIIYNRFALRGRITKNVSANICLNNHFFVADFVDVGLGYYFYSKKQH